MQDNIINIEILDKPENPIQNQITPIESIELFGESVLVFNQDQ